MATFSTLWNKMKTYKKGFKNILIGIIACQGIGDLVKSLALHFGLPEALQSCFGQGMYTLNFTNLDEK